ncbi:ArgP/LysG family DNA-binding transcriptional regulator [Vibrio cholerae]|nr:ArgP/LysG family DNA-binding transcriptional regulator [Vibrio cholerae]
MTDVDPEQARTLATIVTTGSFEAAAVALSVTPSAVSQRIRALETAVGRPVLSRTRPLRPTSTGFSIVRFAHHFQTLSADLAAELRTADEQQRQHITIVANGDSLHTWVLPALASVAATLQIEVLREDQEHSLDLLRSGAAAAAITSESAPVQGCVCHPLGIMRYRPVCTPGFHDEWFGNGATTEELALAPVIVFDRKDDLQDQYLRAGGGRPQMPPRHYVPAAQEFADAIRLGMGWGLVSELELHAQPHDLAPLAAGGHVDVPLYWQQWRHGSRALETVSDAVRNASAVLRQPRS